MTRFPAICESIICGLLKGLNICHGLFLWIGDGEKPYNQFGSGVRLTPRFGLAPRTASTERGALSQSIKLSRWWFDHHFDGLSGNANPNPVAHCLSPLSESPVRAGLSYLIPKSFFIFVCRRIVASQNLLGLLLSSGSASATITRARCRDLGNTGNEVGARRHRTKRDSFGGVSQASQSRIGTHQLRERSQPVYPPSGFASFVVGLTIWLRSVHDCVSTIHETLQGCVNRSQWIGLSCKVVAAFGQCVPYFCGTQPSIPFIQDADNGLAQAFRRSHFQELCEKRFLLGVRQHVQIGSHKLQHLLHPSFKRHSFVRKLLVFRDAFFNCFVIPLIHGKEYCTCLKLCQVENMLTNLK